MVIKLRARHFKNRKWHCGMDCPMALAVREAVHNLGMKDIAVWECVDSSRIGYKHYRHKPYYYAHYLRDKTLAFLLSYSSLTVRKVTIEKFPPQDLSTKTPLEVIEELEQRNRTVNY